MSHLLSDRRFKVLAGAVVAAGAASQFSASSAQAAPIFNYKVLGRNVTDSGTGGGTIINYSASLNASDTNAGDVIEYLIVGNMSPIGTTYTGTGGFTITSLTSPADGANGLRADMFELASDLTQVNLGLGSLNGAGGWTGAPDNSPGTLVPRGNGNNDISAIRPVRAAGDFAAINETVIYSGTMTVTAENPTATSFVRVRWSSGSGSLHVNGSGIAKFPSLTTESGTNAFSSYTPLTIVPVPEPTSLSLLGLAGLGLLARRRKA